MSAEGGCICSRATKDRKMLRLLVVILFLVFAVAGGFFIVSLYKPEDQMFAGGLWLFGMLVAALGIRGMLSSNTPRNNK